MDQAREQLLAGTGLAVQEHRGVALEDPPRQLDGAPQPRLCPDELLERQGPLARRGGFALHRVARQLELVPETCVFASELVALRRAPHDHQQLVGIPGFGNEVVDPARVDRLHQIVDVREGGEHDADRVRGDVLAPPQELDAGHPGHPVIGEDDRHLLPLQDGQRLVAVARAHDRELGRQDRLERVEHTRLVVYDQDRRSLHEGSSSLRDTSGSSGTGSR